MTSTLTVYHNRSSGIKHRGNPDRDNPRNTFDKPAKLKGCIAAAKDFERQIRVAKSKRSRLRKHGMLPAVLDTGLSPINVVESHRIPELKVLRKVHSKRYIKRFMQAAKRAARSERNGGTPFNMKFGKEAAVSKYTYHAALTAVGSALDCIDKVLNDPKQTTFSLAWPPGHHAQKKLAMGFCYFATAAIAAKYARDHKVQRRAGKKNRVLIIDIDHHQGNGTADAVADVKGIYFIDMMYRSPYDEKLGLYTDFELDKKGRKTNAAKEYPPVRNDKTIPTVAHKITTGANIYNHEFVGNKSPDYLVNYFVSKVLPQIEAINPDVIIWSLGIDSAQGDYLGGLGHIPGSFYAILAGIRVAFPNACHTGIQEGGYDRQNWKRILQPCLAAMHPDAPKVAHSKMFKKYYGKFARVARRNKSTN